VRVRPPPAACVLATLTRRLVFERQNVSGRKLVGLRYWNYTSESGENEWQFESRDAEGMATIQAEEKRLFWATLYIMARSPRARVCARAACWPVSCLRAAVVPGADVTVVCVRAAGAVELVLAGVAAEAVAGVSHALPGARPTRAPMRTRKRLLRHSANANATRQALTRAFDAHFRTAADWAGHVRDQRHRLHQEQQRRALPCVGVGMRLHRPAQSVS
jgi:hypothetical protein